MNLFIVGLDLSLTSTGAADENGQQALRAPDRRREKGEARTIEDNMRRLDWLERHVAELFQPVHGDQQALAVIEGYAFGAKGAALFQIGEWGGVCRKMLWENGIPFVVTTPAQVKQYATGRSGAGKEEVISAVTHRSGIVFEGQGASDQADAWVLRQMAMCHYQQEGFVQMPKVHEKALGATDWPQF